VFDVFFFSALGELNVFGPGTGVNQPPTAVMDAPSSDLVIVAGSAVLLSGSGSDPDGHVPLTYRWSVGPGSGIRDLTDAQPGLVQFDRAGTFPLTFVVTDALGQSASVTRTVTVLAGTPLSNAGWSLRFVDSQQSGSGGLYAGTQAFDANPSTFWHTQWMPTQSPLPHEIQIDLGATRNVRGFRYLPRQDGSTIGNIAYYRFYVSADGVNWGPPVASGIFANDQSEKEVATIARSGRYVRLQAVTEVSGLPYTAVAEITVLLATCAGTSVTLTEPLSLQLQTSSTLQVRADACLQTGQGVRFVVDGGTPIDDFSAPYATTVPNITKSEHEVEAIVIDSVGTPVTEVATYDVATPVGYGNYFVATGDGMTLGFGDTIPTDDNSADGRNMVGGFSPILADGLTAAKGYPVTVANEGISGASSVNGVATIGALLPWG
jgi:hypothetical protein